MRKKIIIGTVAVVTVLIVAVALTQWSRLKTAASVAKSATMNEEQVTAKSTENEQITQELQDQYQVPDIQLTPEMQAAIADGTMTLEEAAAQFLTPANGAAEPSEPETAPESNATAAPETETPAPETSAPVPEPETPTPAPETSKPVPEPEPSAPVPEPETPTPAPETSKPVSEPEPSAPTPETSKPVPEPETSKPAPEPEPEAQLSGEQDSGRTEAPQPSEADKAKAETEARVQNLFAQLYVLKSSFSSRLDGIINECIDEFLALDPAKQTRTMKIRIVYGKMDTIEAMEAECNAQVENIASQLDEIDPALGTKARQYYQNEKELKKANLISQYGQ